MPQSLNSKLNFNLALRTMLISSMTLGLLLSVSSNAYSGVTKWVDSNGNVHYSDQPAPPNVKATRLNVEDPTPVAPDSKQKLKVYQDVIEAGYKKRQLEQMKQEKIAADHKAAAEAAKLTAEEEAKQAEEDAAVQSLHSAPQTSQPSSNGYTGYGGYSGYTPLGTTPATPATTQ